MSRDGTRKITVRAADVLRRSRSELHIRHRLSASGTGAHRSRKRYCRKTKHRPDYRGGAD